MIREMLEERGHTVLLASNGEEALARPRMRVLYISGYTDGAISKQGVLGKGVLLLEKPFTVDKLARAVREALDRPAVR